MEINPSPVKDATKPIRTQTEDKLQIEVVDPLTKGNEVSLTNLTEQMFPKDQMDALASQLTPTFITEFTTWLIPTEQRKEVNLPIEEVSRLAHQDLQERAIDRAELLAFAASKKGVADYLATITKTELDRNEWDKKSGVDTVVLESMTASLNASQESLERSIESTQDMVANPLDDALQIQKQKQIILYNSHVLAGIGESTERVSPENSMWGRSHKGVLQADLRTHIGYFSERGASGYSRSDAGSMAHILGVNIASEYGLPIDTKTSRRQVEVYSSGMGALGSVLESVETANTELLVTEGTYFELSELAKKHNKIKEPTPINDNLYFKIAEQAKKEVSEPLVIMAQPFGSGMEEKVFDLDRVLRIIEDSEGNRPIVLVMDSTMHGGSINKWQEVERITASGKDFTFIEMQSLMKHSQMGLDAVPGGVALAYGSHPEIIRQSTGSRGTMLHEHSASVLFPFSSEIQLARIQRAGRNAEYITKRINDAIKANPLFEGVHYASDSDPETAKQYKTKPPILFVKLSPLIEETDASILLSNITGLQRYFPESGKGTSYGFDGSRFEYVSIGRDLSPALRIAAGQESTLQIMALANYIEYRLNDPKFIENVSARLEGEINRIISPIGLNKDALQYSLYYRPDLNSNNTTTSYIESLSTSNILSYLKGSARGHYILKELRENVELKNQLKISDELLNKLSEKLDSKEEIRDLTTQYAITTPEFIDKFREKLSIAGKMPSKERVYQIAKAMNNHKGVKIILGPIAKIANNILKEMQPAIEGSLGTKLPFEY